MNKIEVLLYTIFFYFGWFGCVFLAGTKYSIFSLLFPLCLLGILVVRKSLRPQGLILAVVISGVGVLFDGLLIHQDFISAKGQAFYLMPVWLISIWLLFSFVMIKVGSYFHLPTWAAAFLGFFIGPISYKSGEIFNVLGFLTPFTFLIYAIFWALMFPSILYLVKRFA